MSFDKTFLKVSYYIKVILLVNLYMSKLLGLNPSNVLETIKSKENALLVNANTNMEFVIYENTLLHTQISPDFDLRGAKKIRIYGNSSSATFLQLQFATTLTPQDYQYVDQMNPLTINGSICINYQLETPPPYLRIINNSGNTHQLSLRIILEK